MAQRVLGEPPSKRRKTDSTTNEILKRKDLQPKIRNLLETAYKVKFGTDISEIWSWCQRSSKPLDALKELDIRLIGPFSYLNTRQSATKSSEKTAEPTQLHMLDRTWQCPPEFMPSLADGSSIYGIWRDDPTEDPVFVVQKKRGSGVLTPVATDLLTLLLDISIKKKNTKLTEVFKDLKTKHSASPDISLKKVISARKKHVVASTLNKIGIVVKLTDGDVGYRPITITYQALDRMLTKACETDDESEKDKILAPFDECMNYIQFANDECDFGMGLELGMCLFAHHTSRTYIRSIENLLPLAYELMSKQLYADIMRALCKKYISQ